MMNAHLVPSILAMKEEGHAPEDILRYVTGEGVEFPDATYLVARVLKLSHEDHLEMEENY